MKKRETGFRMLMILLLINIACNGSVYSQSFNDYQKKKVAENVDKLLITGFTRHLDLNDGSGNKPSPNEVGKETFLNCFKDRNSKLIPNFAFNPDSLKNLSYTQPLSPLEYVELFTRMYENGIVSEDITVFNTEKAFRFEDKAYISDLGPNDRDQSSSKFYDKLQIQKDGKGYRVEVPFSISTFSGQYKNKIIKDENGEDDVVIYSPFSNEKIMLLAVIFFNDPVETSGFKITGIENLEPDAGGCFKYLTENSKNKLIDLINTSVTSLLSYVKLSDNNNTFDKSEADKFLKLFSEKTINTMDCKLFFLEKHCQSAEPLKPEEYVKLVDSIYTEFYPLNEKGGREITCLSIEDNNIYVEVKTNIEKPRAKDKDGEWFKPDKIQIVINLLVPSESGINPSKSNDADFSKAYLTHVGLQSVPLKFTPKRKSGSFSYNLHYYLDFPMMPGSDDEMFKQIKVNSKISHDFGISVNYYKYLPEKPWNYGCGLGLIYRKFNTEAGLNSFFDTILDYSHDVLGNIDLYKEGKNLKQTLTYTSISLPITGNMRYDLSQKSFFDFRAGIVPCFNFSGNTTQNSGKASYQGYYELFAGDTLFGSYLIKDVPEYGFTTDQEVKLATDQSKIVFEDISFSGMLGLSFSTLISTTYPIYLDVGSYVQFALSKTFKSIEEDAGFVMDEHGNTGNMFQSGLDGRVNIVGITVGLRWFNKEPGFVKKISID